MDNRANVPWRRIIMFSVAVFAAVLMLLHVVSVEVGILIGMVGILVGSASTGDTAGGGGS